MRISDWSSDVCSSDLEVGRVVEPRRHLAESLEARVAVADHAVEGVHRLVGEKARQAEQQEPEHRRHEAVGKVLGGGLCGGAGDAGGIEARRVAPDDAADRQAPALPRSEEHTSELQSLMRNSSAVFCLEKKT